MRQLHSVGANVVRVWGFCDSEEGSGEVPAFRRVCGCSLEIDESERGLGRLDRLIQIAEELDMTLILPLTNYWPDFGGMALQLRVLGIPYPRPEHFYRDDRAFRNYAAWVQYLLQRRNTCTGRLYCEEPSVLGWELMNEPRCVGCEPGVLAGWVAKASRVVKSLDCNHLLGAGDEGFLHRPRWWQPSGGQRHLYSGNYGFDSRDFLKLSEIDFGCFHLYPENWGVTARFGLRWICQHLAMGQQFRKPMLLEEYGLSSEALRGRWYPRWVSTVRRMNGAGALLWMFGSEEAESRHYTDRYTLRGETELRTVCS